MLKREKIIKYQKVLFENSASAWNSYKFIRNIYKVKIGNEKNKFISNKITNTSNQEEMWYKIKEIDIWKSFGNCGSWRKRSYCQNISLVSKGNFHVKRLLIMS